MDTYTCGMVARIIILTLRCAGMFLARGFGKNSLSINCKSSQLQKPQKYSKSNFIGAFDQTDWIKNVMYTSWNSSALIEQGNILCFCFWQVFAWYCFRAWVTWGVKQISIQTCTYSFGQKNEVQDWVSWVCVIEVHSLSLLLKKK